MEQDRSSEKVATLHRVMTSEYTDGKQRLHDIRKLANWMQSAKGEGPWRKTEEEKPTERTPVIGRRPWSGEPPYQELPLMWTAGEGTWVRAWPYEDGRWPYWLKGAWPEWRPIADD